MTDKTFLLYMFFILQMQSLECQEGEEETNSTRATIPPPQDVDDSDDYEHVTPFTDEELDEIQNVYIGDFSTIKFDYFNNQFLHSYHQRVNERSAQCFDEYFRCMANLVYPVMVCAVNDYSKKYYHKASWISYCDFFLENCRRLTRVFYLVGPGMCDRSQASSMSVSDHVIVVKPTSDKFIHPDNPDKRVF